MSLILASGTISTTALKVIEAFQRVFLVLLALLAIVLIVLVFMQITGSGDSGNVITGNKDSYYSQNKSGSREGRITRLIYICVGLVALFSVVYFILGLI